MKVVISSYTFLPEIGGVATNVSNLANAFHQLGHDTTLVTLARGGADRFPYRVIRQPNPVQLFREYAGADLLVLSNLALKLAYPLFFMRRKFALRHHSESAFNLSDRWGSADRLRKNLALRARHFMTSRYIGERSPYRPYTVTPPFASLDQFTADIRLPIAQRQDAVFVGRLEPEKGIEWLLQRWNEYRRVLDVDRLHIVGDGSLLPQLRKLGADNTCIIFYGAQSRQQTARILSGCRFTFIPSLWAEPFGAVALEALAARTIPILSNRGGLPETVPGFGHYFDPDSESEALAAVRSAKAEFDLHCADSDARAAWEQRCQTYLAGFDPLNVARTIIRDMSL